jgi:hypothetical protein
LDFARRELPEDFDEVRSILDRKSAYRKFKELLARRNALDRWYDFEERATERALRELLEASEIVLAERLLTGKPVNAHAERDLQVV